MTMTEDSPEAKGGPAPAFPFDNSYAALPERFYTKLNPTPVAEPGPIAVNRSLAAYLGLDADALSSPEAIPVFAGNVVPEGAEPLAQVYAGHQFGGWVPQLGDGRALLLGEVIGRDGIRYDIQLKGSGPTPYSRMGDGRAWLGPVIREYILSEAMHALGIPTTRALAAVTTGETVLREAPYPGAVLTRVAQSHLRVGTFQYFAAREDRDGLRDLTQYAIKRHYPDAKTPMEFLSGVVERQANLVALWMGAGFIHGVMNTDNTQIAGETIDYGPCAFMDTYKATQVYSSIDQFGRYAFNRQPDVMVWNLAQLATALLGIIDGDQNDVIAEATEVVNGFVERFHASWLNVFGAKIGLVRLEMEDAALIHRLLDLMEEAEADFTNTFRALPRDASSHFARASDGFAAWHADWVARLARDGASPASRAEHMDLANPAFIPRNHQIQKAIDLAMGGDFSLFDRLNDVLAHPYDPQGGHEDLMLPPKRDEVVRQTFCGT